VPFGRERMIDSLKSQHFDVLIIGGGATGAGAALDSVTRGLKTALIEANDFSFGTSSRSTKLVHGGVRYLENAIKKLDRHEYTLVRDALRERQLFLNNAPHLCRPLAILTPVYSWLEAGYYWMGLKTYDLIAGHASLGKSRYLSKAEALKLLPMIKKEDLCGAVLYYDGQFDDARMNIAIILTAEESGAAVLNYVNALSLIKDGDQIIGVQAHDHVSGQSFAIRSKVVINATGVYADRIRKMDDKDASDIIMPSQGSHVLLPKSYSSDEVGLIIPKTKDGRVIFLLPWQGATLAGTTDHKEPISNFPKATEAEVDYILEYLRNYLDRPIKREDVMATWSGLRPLGKPLHKSRNTAAISRDHHIEISPSKLITIVGGKWTTYRKMAEDVINEAVDVGSLSSKNPCITANMRLIGAQRYRASLADELMGYPGLKKDIAEHLVHAYGDRALKVLELCQKEIKRLVPGFPYIESEVIYALRYEHAIHVNDILARRMRLAFLSNEMAIKALPRVVELMAEELDWDEQKREAERTLSLQFLQTMITKG
jgi:glycerol-3-phosphate dehydrogenase